MKKKINKGEQQNLAIEQWLLWLKWNRSFRLEFPSGHRPFPKKEFVEYADLQRTAMQLFRNLGIGNTRLIGQRLNKKIRKQKEGALG